MKAFWAKDNLIPNVELCFSLTLKKGEVDTVDLIAKDIYNLFINDEFVCYGPARSAKGYARVDSISVKDYLNEETNKMQVFVQANNTKTMCFSDDNPYFGAELKKDGKVVKDGEDFDCYFMNDKVVKIEKMSFQRSFMEVYQMSEDRKFFSKAFVPAKKIRVDTPILLERNVEFAKNEFITPTFYEQGVASQDGEITWQNDFTRNQLDSGKHLYGYTRKECDQIVSYELDKIVYDKDGGLTYKTYEFEHINVGKFSLKLKVSKKTDVWLIYDDLLIGGKVRFNREQIIHALKWTLEKGEYDLLSNEVYQAKYLTVVSNEEIEIQKIGVIAIENPEIEPFKFAFEDEDLTEVVRASVRTFRHNNYDLPTDCASRERAGYLCDGFFTARAERFFTGDNKAERNLLENYLYYKNEVYKDDGILPMCYPSAPKGEDDYIPNWMLWYIVQLEDCLTRTGDKEFVLKHREKVYGVLNFFEKSENEYGLLENLEGWVFVEWSKANDFTDGVNFPSNMLYAGAIESAGRIFGDEKLLQKAQKIKNTIKSLAWDGELFIDNAVRVNGKLTLTTNVSETCQNYAMFFGVITSRENPAYFGKLDDRFGALDEKANRKVHRANMFIGFILRLEILFREGKYAQILKESKEAFLPMAKATGTIWEHFEDHSSCNHGFGAVVGRLVAESIKKLQGSDEI